MQNNTTQTLKINKKILLIFEEGELSGKTGMLLMEEFCNGFGVQEIRKNSSSLLSRNFLLWEKKMNILKY